MKNEIIDNRAYTLKEVVELTGYKEFTLRRRIWAGKIKTISEVGENIMVLGAEIKKFLKIT